MSKYKVKGGQPLAPTLHIQYIIMKVEFKYNRHKFDWKAFIVWIIAGIGLYLLFK